MQDPQSSAIQIVQGVKHLDIVQNEEVSDIAIKWIETKERLG